MNQVSKISSKMNCFVKFVLIECDLHVIDNCLHNIRSEFQDII